MHSKIKFNLFMFVNFVMIPTSAGRIHYNNIKNRKKYNNQFPIIY